MYAPPSTAPFCFRKQVAITKPRGYKCIHDAVGIMNETEGRAVELNYTGG